MNDMKPKTRTIPRREWFALHMKVMENRAVISAMHPGTTFVMADSDFQPTQNMADCRFMAWDNQHDAGLMQVDGAGDAIVLIHNGEWD
jgi:hypothetical protein